MATITASRKEELRKNYGTWAIVTGATSGIGLELSILLADAGFNLILNARNGEALVALHHRLLDTYGIEVKTVVADLGEEDGVQKVIEQAEGCEVGLLINNAGFGNSGYFDTNDISSHRAMIRVNCEAVVALTHYFSRKFKSKGSGGIIFLSSLVAFQGVPYAATYSATKAFVQSFAEALAFELKPFGVDILSVAPGPVESGFAERANMRMNGMKPSEIAVPILNALGKTSSVVPGWLSKLLTYALLTAPRFLKVRIMSIVMGGFTQHQRR